ncbi:hypothetical protein Hdeb2414_s0002g00074771 [Helianthus debilis subsp. tardiflorus]
MSFLHGARKCISLHVHKGEFTPLYKVIFFVTSIIIIFDKLYLSHLNQIYFKIHKKAFIPDYQTQPAPTKVRSMLKRIPTTTTTNAEVVTRSSA